MNLIHRTWLPGPTAPLLLRSGLGYYFLCKRFVVQLLLWLLEFAIHSNSQEQHH